MIFKPKKRSDEVLRTKEQEPKDVHGCPCAKVQSCRNMQISDLFLEATPGQQCRSTSSYSLRILKVHKCPCAETCSRVLPIFTLFKQHLGFTCDMFETILSTSPSVFLGFLLATKTPLGGELLWLDQCILCTRFWILVLKTKFLLSFSL